MAPAPAPGMPALPGFARGRRRAVWLLPCHVHLIQQRLIVALFDAANGCTDLLTGRQRQSQHLIRGVAAQLQLPLGQLEGMAPVDGNGGILPQ